MSSGSSDGSDGKQWNWKRTEGKGNDKTAASSRSSPLGLTMSTGNSSTRSIPTASEIEYCLHTVNYMIRTLKLPLPRLENLEEMTMELLLRIHCSLFGIDFSKEYIPSSHSVEDVERMILSLKDRFGTDKFGALEADKIAAKNPTQLRFLLEHFHLILSHQMAKTKKSRSSKSVADELTTSKSGNHLSVWTPSTSNIKQDSFYVLPHQQDVRGESFVQKYFSDTPAEEDTDGSFQTVENVVLNVYEESTSDDPTNDPLFTRGVDPDPSHRINQSRSATNISRKIPLTSSPIKTGKFSKNHQSPNISSIRNSRSAVGNLVPTINSARPSPSYSKSQPRSQSLQRDGPSVAKNKSFTIPSAQKTNMEVLAKNDNFGKAPFSSNFNRSKSSDPQNQTRKSSETQFMSSFSSDSSQSNDDGALKKMGDMHSDIRRQISESLISLDKDISKLKRKPAKSKSSQQQQQQRLGPCRRPLPDLRWLLPVDARFPNYTGGVIIPKCTSWRKKLRTLARPCSAGARSAANSGRLSTLAQNGSRYNDDNCEEEQEIIFCDE